jgi:two-component system, NtrC family, sensor kinase
MSHDVATAKIEILDRLERATQPHIGLTFGATQALVLAQTWGRWREEGLLLGVFSACYLLNVPLLNWLRRARGLDPDVAEMIRLPVNLASVLVAGRCTEWRLSVWLFLIVLQVVRGIFDTPWVRRRSLAAWALFIPAALLLHAPPFFLGLAAAASISCYLLLQRVSRVLTGMVEQREAQRRELEAAHVELQKLHRAALAQEKLAGLGMLAAGIAHEINNPMSYVTSNVNALLTDLRAEPLLSPALAEHRDDALPATLDGIRRVNSIVADLRRFARGDQERLVGYDRNEEIRAAVRLTQSRLKNRCEVLLDLEELPELEGRPRQLAQVLVNLLVNAAQAIEGQGRIEITSRAGRGEVTFSVRDDGCGMDEAVRSQLFQPFFTTKPVGEGTGLGLSVIHGIVADHGGRIEVDSAPGLGSCFTVTLPLRPPEALDARAPTGAWRVDAVLAANGARP